MKKLLLVIILLNVSFYGFSQEEIPADTTQVVSSYKGAKFGVRGGYTISNLDFEPAPTFENKHRNSFYIGFFAQIGLSNAVAIQPEIQFSPEGANAEPLHLDYIQAPVLFKFKLSEKLHFGAGPQVSLKVHKTDDGIKNFAYSGVAGIEYKINLMLFADIRYTYGFTNVLDDYFSNEAKNTNIQIGVGYKF